MVTWRTSVPQRWSQAQISTKRRRIPALRSPILLAGNQHSIPAYVLSLSNLASLKHTTLTRPTANRLCTCRLDLPTDRRYSKIVELPPPEGLQHWHDKVTKVSQLAGDLVMSSWATGKDIANLVLHVANELHRTTPLVACRKGDRGSNCRTDDAAACHRCPRPIPQALDPIWYCGCWGGVEYCLGETSR
jgi:hypothetical protein